MLAEGWGGTRLRRVVLVALVIGTVWFTWQLACSTPPVIAGDSFVRTLTHADEDMREAILVRGDGQFHAGLATDPSMARPELLRASDREYAYRWMRPLFAWSAWALSGGQPAAVPSVLIALTVLSVGALVAGVGGLATVLERDPLAALACLALPGTLVVLQWTGPEALAAGFGAAGCAIVLRRGRAVPAGVVLLVLAVLARETLLLVAVGVAVWLWCTADRRRDAIAVATAPAMAFAVWAAVVRVRTGSWFFDSGQHRFSAPMVGVLRAAGDWSSDSIFMLALIAGVVILGVLRAGRDRRTVVMLTGPTLAFATIMGEPVWMRWQDAGRVLLPACAVLLLTCFPPASLAVGSTDRGRMPGLLATTRRTRSP